MFELHDYLERDAWALAALVRSREASACDLVDAALAQVARANGEVNAVVWTCEEEARRAALHVNPHAPFAGVPYLQKDLGVAWAGVPNTRGCHYFAGLRHAADSVIAQRLRRAGFILIGLSNSAENGWSLSTEPPLYGATRNPWNLTRTAGGSSGGSGAAVAARMVPIAGATDAAGSIRIPAGNNGLVGLKPSRGRVTFGPQLVDHYCGGTQLLCVSRSVRDTAGYLDAVKGSLPGDPYPTPGGEESYAETVRSQPRSLRIGLLTHGPDDGTVDPHVKAATQRAAALCESLGHAVLPWELRMDHADCWATYTDVIAVQTAMSFAVAALQVGRPVTRADVTPTTWSNIERGRSLSGVEHALNIERYREHGRTIATQVSAFDVVLTPTTPHRLRPLGYWDMQEPDIAQYNRRMGQDCAFTVLFNVSGLPAVSLPLGTDPEGLPIGIQFAGQLGDEAVLLQLAAQLEAAAPWHDRRPPCSHVERSEIHP